MWERRIYMMFVGKPEGTIPLGRLRHRCTENIEIDFKEID
jgi:hypothetical protein